VALLVAAFLTTRACSTGATKRIWSRNPSCHRQEKGAKQGLALSLAQEPFEILRRDGQLCCDPRALMFAPAVPGRARSMIVKP
jgi:hypothetical protein